MHSSKIEYVHVYVQEILLNEQVCSYIKWKWPKRDQTVTRGCPEPSSFGTGITADEARGRGNSGSATGLDPIELFWSFDPWIIRTHWYKFWTAQHWLKPGSGRIYRLPPLPPTPSILWVKSMFVAFCWFVCCSLWCVCCLSLICVALIDSWVTLICVAFRWFMCYVVLPSWRVVIDFFELYWCVLRFVGLCVAHCGVLSCVDLRGAHWSMSFIELCCVSLICVLRCVAVVTGRDRFCVAVCCRRDASWSIAEQAEQAQ